MRKTTITALTLIIFLTLMGKPGFSQVEQGGQPVALSETLSTPVSVDLSPFDVDSAFQADTSAGIYNRMAFPRDITIDIDSQGTWDTLSDSSRVWRIQIHSPDAQTLSLVYDTFWLPSGAQFFVYNGNDSTKYIGSFTNANHKANGNFVTGFQHGDEMILEYVEPAGTATQGRISIISVLHGFRGFPFDDPGAGTLYKAGVQPPDVGTSQPCNIDINCPEGANYQRIKRSVVLIIDTLGRDCSGALINNDNLDSKPYMLTAFHCVHDEDVWQIYFEHESAECPAVNGNPNLQLPIVGAVFQAGDSLVFGEHAMMLLTPSTPDGKIPLSYNPFFAGWSNSSVQVDSTYTIHHPVSDVKKISFEYEPPGIWRQVRLRPRTTRPMRA